MKPKQKSTNVTLVMCLVCHKVMTQRKLDTIKRHTIRRHVELLSMSESDRENLFNKLVGAQQMSVNADGNAETMQESANTASTIYRNTIAQTGLADKLNIPLNKLPNLSGTGRGRGRQNNSGWSSKLPPLPGIPSKHKVDKSEERTFPGIPPSLMSQLNQFSANFKFDDSAANNTIPSTTNSNIPSGFCGNNEMSSSIGDKNKNSFSSSSFYSPQSAKSNVITNNLIGTQPSINCNVPVTNKSEYNFTGNGRCINSQQSSSILQPNFDALPMSNLTMMFDNHGNFKRQKLLDCNGLSGLSLPNSSTFPLSRLPPPPSSLSQGNSSIPPTSLPMSDIPSSVSNFTKTKGNSMQLPGVNSTLGFTNSFNGNLASTSMNDLQPFMNSAAELFNRNGQNITSPIDFPSFFNKVQEPFNPATIMASVLSKVINNPHRNKKSSPENPYNFKQKHPQPPIMSFERHHDQLINESPEGSNQSAKNELKSPISKNVTHPFSALALADNGNVDQYPNCSLEQKFKIRGQDDQSLPDRLAEVLCNTDCLDDSNQISIPKVTSNLHPDIQKSAFQQNLQKLQKDKVSNILKTITSPGMLSKKRKFAELDNIMEKISRENYCDVDKETLTPVWSTVLPQAYSDDFNDQKMMGKGSGLLIHILKFTSGQNISKSLAHYINDKKITYAFIVACSGSIKLAQLTYANGSEERSHGFLNSEYITVQGPHKIISLNGTLGISGMNNLLTVLSNYQGQIIGGSVVGDLIVDQTSHIVLGSIDFQIPEDIDYLMNSTTEESKVNLNQNVDTIKNETSLSVDTEHKDLHSTVSSSVSLPGMKVSLLKSDDSSSCYSATPDSSVSPHSMANCFPVNRTLPKSDTNTAPEEFSSQDTNVS